MSLPQERPRARVPSPLNLDFLAPSSDRLWAGGGGWEAWPPAPCRLLPSFAVPESRTWRLEEHPLGLGSLPTARVRQHPSSLQAATQSCPAMGRPWGGASRTGLCPFRMEGGLSPSRSSIVFGSPRGSHSTPLLTFSPSSEPQGLWSRKGAWEIDFLKGLDPLRGPRSTQQGHWKHLLYARQ